MKHALAATAVTIASMAALPATARPDTASVRRHQATGRASLSRSVRKALLGCSALITATLLQETVRAQDATWLQTPGSGDFNDAANWNPTVIPAGTAFFGTSNVTDLSFSAATPIGGWTFNAGADDYTFLTTTANLGFTGAGIVINGGSATIINYAGLIFSESSSAGSATISNNASMFFQGSSSAGNATITNRDQLQFRDSSSAGSASITNDAGDLQFVLNSSAGSARIRNLGSLQFNDTSTAGSAAIDNFGTLRFDQMSTAGSANILNYISVDFHGSSTAASATITGAFLAFHDTSTAANATLSDIQDLRFFGSSTAGSAAITNNDLLQFYNTSTAGSGTITNNNVLNFFDASSAGSAIIANNSGLGFGNSSSAGSAVITTTAGATTQFSAQSSGADARMITEAGGIVDISSLTSSGTTFGSIAGAGTYALGSKALAVGSDGSSTDVSGIVTDGGLGGGVSGSLTKAGSGTLTLSGVNTYTGATYVTAGGLIVNGSIAASTGLFVDAGGLVGGTGVLPSTVIGGTLSPGNSIGTINVAGPLTFNATSSYIVEFSPTAADRTDVTGAATLAGGVNAIDTGGTYTMGTRHTVLTATGGLGGTQFDSLTASGGFGIVRPTLEYDANTVYLAFTPNAFSYFLTGLNQNQQSVADAIDAAVPFIAGPERPLFDSLFNLPEAQIPRALTQLSGEVATGAPVAGFQSMMQFVDVMLDPFLATRGQANGPALALVDDAMAYAAKDRVAAAPVFKALPGRPAPRDTRITLWGSVFGARSDLDGQPTVGSSDVTARNWGVATGVDFRVTPDTIIGAAFAGGHVDYALAAGLGSGKGETFQGGLYGSTRLGNAYESAAVAYGAFDLTTNRTVAFPGMSEQLRGDFTAHGVTGRIESGSRFAIAPQAGITPFGALVAQTFETPDYAETAVAGPGAAALSFAERDDHRLRTELGLRFDSVLAAWGDSTLTLRGRAGWAHEFETGRTAAATFVALPGFGFGVTGAALAADAGFVSAGTEWTFANGLTLAAKFDGEFASRSESYAGTASIRYAW